MSARPTRLAVFRSAEKLASIAARVGASRRLAFQSCAQPPVRDGFALASRIAAACPQATSE
jgi:hypothetical protein